MEHLYTTPVFELDLKAEPPSFIQELDVIYVYEDGLWSGVELVKRLALLASWQPIKSRDLKVVFRYGATTDAGLLAGRNFIRRERLTPSIEIQNASPIYHYTMLDKMTFNGDLSLRSVLEDDAFRQLLDDRIDPYAFRASNLWKERLTEAIDVCKKIGSQLVRPWLQSTKGGDDLENHVAKWSLGAFGYASMITFSTVSTPSPT